jgi:hypothetical protein
LRSILRLAGFENLNFAATNLSHTDHCDCEHRAKLTNEVAREKGEEEERERREEKRIKIKIKER